MQLFGFDFLRTEWSVVQVDVVTKEFVPEVGDKVATPYGTGCVVEIRSAYA
jgi:hypothetical protein